MIQRLLGCPICQGPYYRSLNSDAITCPRHGEITLEQRERLSKLEPIDALIELRGEQAIDEIRDMAKRAVWWKLRVEDIPANFYSTNWPLVWTGPFTNVRSSATPLTDVRSPPAGPPLPWSG